MAGTVRLVPHEGLPSHPQGGAYGDRRLRDVQLVDYSKPGTSVVYLDLAARPGGRAELAVEESVAGARLEPRLAVVGAGGEVAVANRTTGEVVVSVPAADRVERIAAGASLSLRADRAGPLEIYLLGAAEPARVWVSPGPWVRPDASGHFALSGLAPGHATLHAWHPRLPSAAADVDLRAGETATVNFEIGVGRGEGAHEPH
ncbi:MAG TPA: carboxypeptidase-like regulatory domain-containing protein [Myxococcota bacterium]|nr:carboxypeptidase-like regulatory domain-containing protein [Myxococcota bacterium]